MGKIFKKIFVKFTNLLYFFSTIWSNGVGVNKMDKRKADEIITQYLQKIYGFAVKKSFSFDEAEDLCSDIVQEVYLSLLKAGDIANIDGYIWRISSYTYSKYVSRKKKQEGVSIDNVILPYYEDYSLEDPDEDLFRLRREVAFLTKTRRQIVYLFYYENHSVSHISKTLAIPEGTVKWHLNKARNELKENFTMERKIGTLGISPYIPTSFGHNGNPGSNSGPEFYLGDKLNCNIVYSVYFEPRSTDEIAEELGVTPVYIEDKVAFLEENGFLIKQPNGKYTTYVQFDPTTYSLELEDRKTLLRQELAQTLAREYAPKIIESVKDITELYVPTGNRQLFEAAAIFYGVANKCYINTGKDLGKYFIKTTAGGNFAAHVNCNSQPSDPDYKPKTDWSKYWSCGNMTRWSDKYPAVYSWSIDTRLSSRKGGWVNNTTEDYEYVYELLNGTLDQNEANAEKFSRLKEREFITDDGEVNIMLVKGKYSDVFDKIPPLEECYKEKIVSFALEYAAMIGKQYPPQMQDLITAYEVGGFIGNTVAVMVMDILYSDGTFAPLTDKERVTSNLLMFTDVLPQ